MLCIALDKIAVLLCRSIVPLAAEQMQYALSDDIVLIHFQLCQRTER